ncbi:putative methyltransferase [Gordonia rhizosphera NBRC 16068]|uniref:Putative methyltransferase n=2 Tax=Gordonia rhizosphera TaxID=83341 RepID=K6W9P3_9ACTN|nr:putative methyltransferase [Gordonia rhizosphera NBRC 16068]
MATVLDLDAVVCGEYLTDIPDQIAERIVEPRTIVDLGSGTGTGTLALARRFPTARVVALDNSSDLLTRVAGAAADAGLADRVTITTADLDAALPSGLTDVDVVWASSTLHHFADPDALLRSVYRALRPGGILAAVEIDELPTFLAAGSGGHEMELRLRSAMADGGWNAHPDWAGTITAAGFELVETRIVVTDPADTPERTADYAVAWLTHARSGLAESLTASERAALDALLSDDDPTSLRRRDDLALHARRIAWIARRPATTLGEELS